MSSSRLFKLNSFALVYLFILVFTLCACVTSDDVDFVLVDNVAENAKPKSVHYHFFTAGLTQLIWQNIDNHLDAVNVTSKCESNLRETINALVSGDTWAYRCMFMRVSVLFYFYFFRQFVCETHCSHSAHSEAK